MGTAPGPSRAIRPLWLRVYLPNLVIATGQGAMVPVLVYAAKQVHASTAEAALVVALNSLGTMLSDLPSGRLIARFGERRSGQLAGVMLVAGLIGCLLAAPRRARSSIRASSASVPSHWRARRWALPAWRPPSS
ncbi:MAG: MFS transporter [Acidimicrobiales bacterium]